MPSEDIIIIGAGLSGLTLAYLLKKDGRKVTIIEARDRIGGRIYTEAPEGKAPIEMGATWLGKKHQKLSALLEELNIPVFEQRLGKHAIYEPISTSPPQLVKLPPNDDPSYRIAGGSSRLIQALFDSLPEGTVRPAEVLKTIRQIDGEIELKTSKQTYRAKQVISTLPPYLLIQTVSFSPALPDDLIQVAFLTHTWMGDSIKVGLRCVDPFWRMTGTSGTIFSNSGPLPEMYDHADAEEEYFALKGFLNGAYHAATKEERKDAVLNQLKRYYGEGVSEFTDYTEAVWREEPFTFIEYNGYILPHQHNGHAVYQKSYFDGQLIIGGSETATQFPGYMEGAVESAYSIKKRLGSGAS